LAKVEIQDSEVKVSSTSKTCVTCNNVQNKGLTITCDMAFWRLWDSRIIIRKLSIHRSVLLEDTGAILD
jgi:hypothetical protein